jgi:hypothetical protein
LLVKVQVDWILLIMRIYATPFVHFFPFRSNECAPLSFITIDQRVVSQGRESEWFCILSSFSAET